MNAPVNTEDNGHEHANHYQELAEGAPARTKSVEHETEPKEEKSPEEPSSAKELQVEAGTSDNEENGGPPRPHPLLIEHVLDNVFKYIVGQSAPRILSVRDGYELDLPPGPERQAVLKDVKSARLVCKAWKDSVTPLYLRTRPPIRFGRSYGEQDEVRGKAMMKMRKLLRAMQNSDLIPVQSFIFHGDFLAFKKAKKVFQDFLAICGPDAVEMSFNLRLRCDSDTTRFKLTPIPYLDLMNLKTLELSGLDYRPSKLSLSLAHSIVVLLDSAKALREFKFDLDLDLLTSDVGHSTAEEYAFLRQFQELVCRSIPKSVKILTLNVVLTEATLQHLIENGPYVEELGLPLTRDLDNEMIQNFLESQAATLKVLRICESSLKPLNALEFARLNQLVHLKLTNVKNQPVAFAEVFPKLEVLDLAQWEWGYDEIVEKIGLPYSRKVETPTVKELRLSQCMPVFPLGPHIANLSAYFPMITKLHVGPDQYQTVNLAKEVFTHFCSIESLRFSFPLQWHNENVMNLDSILSGVPSQITKFCEVIVKLEEEQDFDQFDFYLRQWKDQPSIRNLTKLKKLVLDTKEPQQVVLTDFSAHFVFLQMAALEELTLYHCRGLKLSPRYTKLLEQKLTFKLEGFEVPESWYLENAQ